MKDYATLCCDECEMQEDGIVFYDEFDKLLCRDCYKFLVRQSLVHDFRHKPITELLREYEYGETE